MNKNKTFLCISIAVVALASVIAWRIYTYNVMLNYDDAYAYCQANSKRNANEFDLMGGGSGIDGYYHFIAMDGDEEKGQELFIFKRNRRFINLAEGRVGRYTLYVHAFDENTPVGSLRLTLRDDWGKKDSGDTIYFFGSNKGEKAIENMTYTYFGVDENGETAYEYKRERPWPQRKRIYWNNYNDLGSADRFFLIGMDENGIKWDIKDVKFYDDNGKVVYEY